MMNEETMMLEALKKVEESHFEKAVREKFGEADPDRLDEAYGRYHPNLLDMDNTPVPKEVSVFKVGEEVELKGYRYKVVGIEEKKLTLEPSGPFAKKKSVFNKKKRPKKKRRM